MEDEFRSRVIQLVPYRYALHGFQRRREPRDQIAESPVALILGTAAFARADVRRELELARESDEDKQDAEPSMYPRYPSAAQMQNEILPRYLSRGAWHRYVHDGQAGIALRTQQDIIICSDILSLGRPRHVAPIAVLVFTDVHCVKYF